MDRTRASYVVITAISGAILGTIACDKPTGSEAISDRSDAARPAPDLGKESSEDHEIALVRAVEYATGANHESPDVDWNAIEDINAMWAIASITKSEAAAEAFAKSQNKGAEPAAKLELERPAYSECEAKMAEPGALNELLPVLFQHPPVDEAKAHWEPLRKMVADAKVVEVSCKEAPKIVVGVVGGRVVAARESLEEALELQPRDEPEGEPEPGGPPPVTIRVTSPVEGAAIVFDETEAELPHKLTGINSSKTLRFKAKAPGHLEAEVGALPMDVLTMLQGGEPQTQFDWVVWPNPAR